MREKNWDRKIHDLRETYPEIRNIDWARLVSTEPEIFRGIAGDVAKVGVDKKAKPHSATAQAYAQLINTDYSELPFVEALNILWGDRSINDMTHKTKISKELIYRMKRGLRHPSFEEMEQIARSFGKDPSFFLEYRIGKVLAAIDVYLRRSPEVATVWHSKVVKAEGLKVYDL